MSFVFVIWITYVVFFPIRSLLKKWVLLCGGTGTGFSEQSRLGEAIPSLQVFVGMLLRCLLALGSSCGTRTWWKATSGWAEGFRVGLSLDHPGDPWGHTGARGQVLYQAELQLPLGT